MHACKYFCLSTVTIVMKESQNQKNVFHNCQFWLAANKNFFKYFSFP